jgi:CubicO group peptidase (beta-lactamase class C family)
MDRHRVFRSVIACMLTAACRRAGTVQANGPDPPVEQIDRYVAGRMRAARIPGLALAIVKRDRAVYVQAYGVADPTGRPVTPDTPFEIGSITKAVTALAVMQLVEAGRVQLDAPVQRYLPWFRVADAAASARISVRQLLTMTSGLPQLYEPQLWTAQDDGVVERAVRLLANADLARPVGSGTGVTRWPPRSWASPCPQPCCVSRSPSPHGRPSSSSSPTLATGCMPRRRHCSSRD